MKGKKQKLDITVPSLSPFNTVLLTDIDEGATEVWT